MPWELLPTQSRSTQTPRSAQIATIRSQGIALSSSFVANQQLAKYDHVEVFIDDTLRRIGLKFHDTATTNTLKFAKPGTRPETMSRVIYTIKIFDRKWIADILSEDLSSRQFLIETDDSVEKPTDGVRYYVSVGYRFQPRRRFGTQGDYPRLPGVYRLFKDSEIVRIGESDYLEKRLKQHISTYEGKVDEYDFMAIPDQLIRKREEKRLLAEYRDAYGRLPKLNPVVA